MCKDPALVDFSCFLEGKFIHRGPDDLPPAGGSSWLVLPCAHGQALFTQINIFWSLKNHCIYLELISGPCYFLPCAVSTPVLSRTGSTPNPWGAVDENP
jgi:hypothetical protein